MTQTHAQDFKPNYLTEINACKTSGPFLDMLEAARKGKESEATMMFRASIMAGECKLFQLIMYQPEAVVHLWEEDDGSGGPGAVVAGWILGPEGEKRLQAFIWVTPDLLKEHFGVKEEGA